MPQLGLTMEEGTLLRFLVQVGDFVEAGQDLLEVETDKAVNTVPSSDRGYLREVCAAPNTEYPVGTVLAYLTDTADEALARS